MRRFNYRDFLDDLSTLLRSGLPVLEALESMTSDLRSPRSRFASHLLERVRAGDTLGDALDSSDQVSAVDANLVRAGESSGKLVEILDSMVRRLDARKALRVYLLKRSLYAISMLVIACVLLPLYLLVTGDRGTYVLIQACVFLPALFLGWVVSRGPALFGELSPCREPYERLLLCLPLVGRLLARLAFARAFETLGLLVQAGVGYRDGIPLAAGALRWKLLRRGFLQVHAGLEAGMSVTDSLRSIEPYLGERSWRERVSTGDVAGKVDRAFLQIAHEWDERFERSMQHALRVLPVALILVVGLIVAMRFLAVFEGIYGVR